MGIVADAKLAFSNLRAIKDAQDAIRGSMLTTDRLTSRGKTPPSDKKAQVGHYKQWVYSCANKNASGVKSSILRVFATRARGQQRAGSAFGKELGRPISKEMLEHLKTIPSIASTAQFKAAEEVEELVEHPVIDLLKEVNPHHNQHDLLDSLSLYLDLAGDAYWHIVDGPLGIPAEIWSLQSQFVKIIPDAKDFVRGYQYGRSTLNQVSLEADEVIHFKRFNPHDAWYGMSRIEGLFMAIVGSESFDKFETHMADTHGMQQMLIKYKAGSMDARTRRTQMAEWRNALHMASRMRAPIIADEEFDITPVQWSPREMAFLGGREWRKAEIITGFGQHQALYDKNANTANIRGAIYLWEEYEITPTLRLVEQKLNEQLMPRYGEDRIFLAFDNVVESDTDQERKDDDLLLKHGYPLNRILARRGMDPVEGGDVGNVPGTLVPLEDVGKEPEPLPSGPVLPAADDGGDNGDGTRGIVTSSSRRREPSYTSERPSSGFINQILMCVKENGEVDLTGGANPNPSRREKKMRDAVKTVWAAQFALILPEVRKGSAAAFDWVASESWAQEIVDLTEGFFAEEVTFGAGRGAKKIGFTLTDFVDRPAVESAIKRESFKFARSVNEGTANLLRESLLKSEQLGESIPQTAKRIEGLHESWDKSRSLTIARTESARAEMLGQELEWQESGVVSAKIWDASGDACPFCRNQHGKVMPLGDSYFKTDGPNQTVDFEDRQITLKHEYLDVKGPPLHPNCRCDLQPQLIES